MADGAGSGVTGKPDSGSRGCQREDGHAEEGPPDSISWSVFGDAVGLAVFLGALVALGATWQVGVFITDTYAIANGLVNVANGHLAVERVQYGLTLDAQPGLHVGNDELYARNYGQAFLALPIYFTLDLLADFLDLHLLLVVSWAGIFAMFCRQLGIIVGLHKQLQIAGSLGAVLVVVSSIPLIEPIDTERVGIIALQVVSLLAVAVTALALYRVGQRVRGRRVGAAVGVTTVLAAPLWFWASIPKRHAITAAAVAILLVLFLASRNHSGRSRLPVLGKMRRSLSLRVTGYLLVGLVTWVHAFEGIVLLGAFGLSDLATASDLSRRALLAIGVATAIGFMPVFATNVAVTGSPFEPPRLAQSYSPDTEDFEIGPGGEVLGPGDQNSVGNGVQTGEQVSEEAESNGHESQPTSAREPDGDGTALGPVGDLATGAVGFSTTAVSHGQSILGEAKNAPGRLYRTYLRSGRASNFISYGTNSYEPIDLTLLETNPLFGGLAGALVGSGAAMRPGRRRLRSVGARIRSLPAPTRWRQRVLGMHAARQTDLFGLAVVIGFGVMYFPRLPLHSQLTVRYILPMVPVLLYLLVRVPLIAEPIVRRPRWLAGGYAASVAIGLVGVGLVLPRLQLAVGEAMQLHGLVNLGVATVLVVTLLSTRFGHEDDRLRAIALALAGGATTTLVVAMQLAYFEYGTYAVPVVRILAEAVSVV